VIALGVYGTQRTSLVRQGPSLQSAADLPVAAHDWSDAAPANQIEHRPTLLVVGDSFAGGAGDATITTYPQLVADKMGWNLRMDAVGGSGFTANSLDDQTIEPFINRLASDASHFSVDYLLIDGGRNDLQKQPEPVIIAMDEFLKRVREYWPNATIVIMKPQYATMLVADNYPAISAAIDRTAADIDVKVIDPVAEGWYNDVDLDALLMSDRVHLNGPGQQFYADHIVDALKRLGITGAVNKAQGGSGQ